MKKIRVSFLLIFITILNTGFSQVSKTLINKIDSLRQHSQHQQAIDLLQNQTINDSNQVWITYELACFSSLIQNEEMAFKYLKNAIELGAKPEHVIIDTDFDFIRTTRYWDSIDNKLNQLFLAKYRDVKEPKLAIKLWRMGIEDQKFRTLRKYYKKPLPKQNTDKAKKLNQQLTKEWNTRTDTVLNLIKQKGWPGYSMVGEKASEAAFLIMQHSDIKPMRKAYRKLKKAAKNGDASMIHYAMMCDRNRIIARFDILKRKQIYGTQITGKPIIIDGKPKFINGQIQYKNELAPLKNPQEVNKRRAEVGLNPIQEYLKKWDIEFNIPQK